MITHKQIIRVAYSDTDKMGVVHHSNYAKYFEVARWELFRSRGLSYAEIEQVGYMFPVVFLNSKYQKKAFYDDLLSITSEVTLLKGARLCLNFVVKNADNEVVNISNIELACVRANSWKPCPIPDFILEKLKS